MVGHSHHEHQKEHSEKTEQHGQHQRHTAHGIDHTGHEQMFRTRFWWSLLLSIPVLLYSEAIQNWLGFGMHEFPVFGQLLEKFSPRWVVDNSNTYSPHLPRLTPTFSFDG